MITTSQFKPIAGPNEEPELIAFDHMLNAFVSEMREKFRYKFNQGFRGWDDPQMLQTVWELLEQHVRRGPAQMIDVGLLSAMVWNLMQR